MHVIYRVCGQETVDFPKNRPGHRPEWFSKFDCFTSLMNSIRHPDSGVTRFSVIYDGPKASLFSFIEKTVEKMDNSEIKCINQNHYVGSLRIATQLAIDVGDDTYLVEDDYLHKPDAIAKMRRALPKYKLLTGYDHPDRYTRSDDIDYPKIIDFDAESNSHWRTIESTCHTYMIEKNLLNDAKSILMYQPFLENDRSLWRFFNGNNIRLWSSIPGLTTQVDPYMSPGIDWSDKKWSTMNE